MTNKVVDLDEIKGLLSPNKVLEKMGEMNLEDVIAIGYTEGGSLILGNSPLTPAQLVYMLEQVKLIILSEEDTDDD